jgi:hypothetical protein
MEYRGTNIEGRRISEYSSNERTLEHGIGNAKFGKYRRYRKSCRLNKLFPETSFCIFGFRCLEVFPVS